MAVEDLIQFQGHNKRPQLRLHIKALLALVGSGLIKGFRPTLIPLVAKANPNRLKTQAQMVLCPQRLFQTSLYSACDAADWSIAFKKNQALAWGQMGLHREALLRQQSQEGWGYVPSQAIYGLVGTRIRCFPAVTLGSFAGLTAPTGLNAHPLRTGSFRTAFECLSLRYGLVRVDMDWPNPFGPTGTKRLLASSEAERFQRPARFSLEFSHQFGWPKLELATGFHRLGGTDDLAPYTYLDGAFRVELIGRIILECGVPVRWVTKRDGGWKRFFPLNWPCLRLTLCPIHSRGLNTDKASIFLGEPPIDSMVKRLGTLFLPPDTTVDPVPALRGALRGSKDMQEGVKSKAWKPPEGMEGLIELSKQVLQLDDAPLIQDLTQKIFGEGGVDVLAAQVTRNLLATFKEARGPMGSQAPVTAQRVEQIILEALEELRNCLQIQVIDTLESQVNPDNNNVHPNKSISDLESWFATIDRKRRIFLQHIETVEQFLASEHPDPEPFWRSETGLVLRSIFGDLLHWLSEELLSTNPPEGIGYRAGPATIEGIKDKLMHGSLEQRLALVHLSRELAETRDQPLAEGSLGTRADRDRTNKLKKLLDVKTLPEEAAILHRELAPQSHVDAFKLFEEFWLHFRKYAPPANAEATHQILLGQKENARHLAKLHGLVCWLLDRNAQTMHLAQNPAPKTNNPPGQSSLLHPIASLWQLICDAPPMLLEKAQAGLPAERDPCLFLEAIQRGLALLPPDLPGETWKRLDQVVERLLQLVSTKPLPCHVPVILNALLERGLSYPDATEKTEEETNQKIFRRWTPSWGLFPELSTQVLVRLPSVLKKIWNGSLPDPGHSPEPNADQTKAFEERASLLSQQWQEALIALTLGDPESDRKWPGPLLCRAITHLIPRLDSLQEGWGRPPTPMSVAPGPGGAQTEDPLT